MASITIRNLDETTKRRLRLRAAQRNRSMEEEVRQILQVALTEDPVATGNLADAIGRRFRKLGGVNLRLATRGPARKPPTFG